MLKVKQKPTKVLVNVAPALSARVRISLWAVLERIVLITNIVEEMDLVLFRKQRCADAMHWCISPPLIVETTLLIEEIKEFHVSFATPEVEVTDLKVTPDYTSVSQDYGVKEEMESYSGTYYKSRRCRQR